MISNHAPTCSCYPIWGHAPSWDASVSHDDSKLSDVQWFQFIAHWSSLLSCHQLDNIPLLGVSCQYSPWWRKHLIFCAPSSVAFLAILLYQHGRCVVLINCCFTFISLVLFKNILFSTMPMGLNHQLLLVHVWKSDSGHVALNTGTCT